MTIATIPGGGGGMPHKDLQRVNWPSLVVGRESYRLYCVAQ